MLTADDNTAADLLDISPATMVDVTPVPPDDKTEEEISSRQTHNIYVSDKAKNKEQREPFKIRDVDFSKGLITKRKYPDNVVRTTIYTWWNFIVLNILIQYTTKFSNVYFTVVMIFSMLPGVSPVFPVTSIIPVVFIVGVNMLKDGFEDFVC
jgi:phospholipid-transporting ATPase